MPVVGRHLIIVAAVTSTLAMASRSEAANPWTRQNFPSPPGGIALGVAVDEQGNTVVISDKSAPVGLGYLTYLWSPIRKVWSQLGQQGMVGFSDAGGIAMFTYGGAIEGIDGGGTMYQWNGNTWLLDNSTLSPWSVSAAATWWIATDQGVMEGFIAKFGGIDAQMISVSNSENGGSNPRPLYLDWSDRVFEYAGNGQWTERPPLPTRTGLTTWIAAIQSGDPSLPKAFAVSDVAASSGPGNTVYEYTGTGAWKLVAGMYANQIAASYNNGVDVPGKGFSVRGLDDNGELSSWVCSSGC